MSREATLGWGVIGAGGIADRRMIPALQQARHCRVVALCDTHGVDAIADRYGVACRSKNYEAVLEHSDVQVVYIATPAYLHEQQIIDAAEAGKHILCEKPLTLSRKGTQKAVSSCRRHRVRLREAFMMPYHGAHRRIAELVRAGELGTLTSLRAQLSCWYPPIRGAWRQDPATGGGGALIDLGAHLLDLLESFAGPIDQIVALTGRQVHDYRSEDASSCLLRFGSGAHGTIDCYFNIPDPACRARLEVHGASGAVITEGTIGQGEGGTAMIIRCPATDYDPLQDKSAAQAFEPLVFRPVNPYQRQCEAFASAILDDKPSAEDDYTRAMHVAELIDKAYVSAATGRRLAIDGQYENPSAGQASKERCDARTTEE